MSETRLTREYFELLDQKDLLRGYHSKFQLPGGIIYLDGNSLGPLVKGVKEKVDYAISEEWGNGLISSWNQADWFDLPTKVGNKIAKLIGAKEGEVIVGDSTSLNIFKLATALLKKQKNRRKIIVEKENFPTDIYILQGIVEIFEPQFDLIFGGQEEIDDLIDEDTALVLLTQVNYRTGQIFDMESITKKANSRDAPIIWDLCHSAGALPLQLNRFGVKYAVGCSYKYLNGGPGAPAYTYVAEESIEEFEPIVTGWHSHARQFEFEIEYEADISIKKTLVGTPTILSLVSLNAALDIWKDVDITAVRRKSLTLTNSFIELIESRCSEFDLRLHSPRDDDLRGSQVSWGTPNGYEIMQALINRKVIGDFRPPDVMRFGFTPLYTRFVDVFDAVTQLKEILETEEWRRPEFSIRQAVT